MDVTTMDVEAEVHRNEKHSNHSEKTPIIHVKRTRTGQLLLGIDMSAYSVLVQYLVPAAGLFLFSCLGSYLQELVVYGFFERKWSHLQTFLHYLWLTICVQIQTLILPKQRTSIPSPIHSFPSMGSATPTTSIFYYILLSLLKTLTATLSNLSMRLINYPVKVLCKSALPIVTMLIGIVWFRKTYFLRDYVVSFLLVIGLYIFISDDAATTLEGTRLGVALLFSALVGSSCIVLVQEHIIEAYNASIEQLLYFPFIGSTLLSGVFLLASGEAVEGVFFLARKGTLSMWLSFFALNTCKYMGFQFAVALTARFGSVLSTLTTTSRKATSIALSFVMFPQRNVLHTQHVLGAGVFFTGVLLRGMLRGEKGVLTVSRKKHDLDDAASTASMTQHVQGSIKLRLQRAVAMAV